MKLCDYCECCLPVMKYLEKHGNTASYRCLLCSETCQMKNVSTRFAARSDSDWSAQLEASDTIQPGHRLFEYAKTKTQISFAVTTKLISAFVFAT